MELKKSTVNDVEKICLCEYRDGSRLSVNVWAAISSGRLLISGQDLGDFVKERFADSDYEYWYSFDVENTKVLITKLSEQNPTLDIKALLTENFSGLDGCRNLRDFCKEFDIRYDFSSHI
ncbi:hypothetical protein [Flavobacterium sp.]|uniref:hypothetical protein n=1 Tax=Flavobacterium sp. TaxID=239 RepID=UPI002603F8FC|nr:hypothetical protein [Flavobacterium sp.]